MILSKESAVRDYLDLTGTGAISALKDYIQCKQAECFESLVRAEDVQEMYRLQGALRALGEIICDLQLEGNNNGR